MHPAKRPYAQKKLIHRLRRFYNGPSEAGTTADSWLEPETRSFARIQAVKMRN